MRFEIPNVLNGTVIETTFYHDKNHETPKEKRSKNCLSNQVNGLLCPEASEWGDEIWLMTGSGNLWSRLIFTNHLIAGHHMRSSRVSHRMRHGAADMIVFDSSLSVIVPVGSGS